MSSRNSLCNRSIAIKLDDCVLSFVFSDVQNRNFSYTSYEHLHSSFELHFVISGGCTFSAEGVLRTVSAGDVVVIPPHLPHFFTDYSSDFKKVDIRVSKLADDGGGAYPPFNMERVTLLKNMTKITCYAEDFYEAMGMTGRNGEIITRSALTLLYFTLLKELGCDDDDASFRRESSGASYDYIVIEDCIMQSYMRDISLKNVAERTGFSTTHIGRVVKKNYGMSYSELVLKLRMEHAKKLILDGIPVTEIYGMIGYSSYNGFALAFKRYHKMPPEQMRRENLKDQ